MSNKNVETLSAQASMLGKQGSVDWMKTLTSEICITHNLYHSVKSIILKIIKNA